ncbi:hypothetical protein GCM10023075_79540 [Streptosporangium album]
MRRGRLLDSCLKSSERTDISHETGHFYEGPREQGRVPLSPLQTAREIDLGPYGELNDPERIVGNLHRAYAELGGAALTPRAFRRRGPAIRG